MTSQHNVGLGGNRYVTPSYFTGRENAPEDIFGYLNLIRKGPEMETSEALKKSFGYRLINSFAARLKADLEIDSSNGTTIKLRIKEFKKVS